MRILIVCVGNVCRSPLAERLLRRALADQVAAGLVEVTSAGTGALDGRPMEPAAAAELERLGGSAEGFVARPVTEAVLAGSDLVLTATTDVRKQVVGLAPAVLHRTFTLKELALVVEQEAQHVQVLPDVRRALRALSARRGAVARNDLDVPDPMGRDAERHREAADQVAAAVAVLAPLVAVLVEEQRAARAADA
ncbi:arsenate reductase/protein-tyrosine-phosphatase family protein [Nocardioides zeae]